MYWLLFPLRQLFTAQAFNLAPKANTVAETYKAAIPFIRKIHAEWGHKPIKDITQRAIYEELIKSKVTVPKVFNLYFVLNGVDGKKVFKNLSNSQLSNEPRDLLFKIIHLILPTKARLSRLHIINNYICPLCKTQVETDSHLVFECVKLGRLLTLC